MSSGGVTITMKARDAGLKALVEDVTKGQRALSMALGNTGTAAKSVAAEMQAMARKGLVTQEMRKPLEDYKATLKEAIADLKAGTITQETFNRAMADARTKLHDAIGATAKLDKEQKNLARAAEQVKEAFRSPLDRYTIKVAELDRLLKAGRITQDEHTRAVRQAKSELDGAGKAGESAFGPQALGMVRNLAAALGLAGGLAGAVQLVRKEYERFKEVQKEAAAATITVAEAEETALINLGAETKEERDAYLADVERIAREQGVSRKDVHVRASTALSARGAQTPEAAMQAVEASIKFAPGDTGAGTAAAGAALDIGGATGMTPEQAIGYLQSVGKLARITGPAEVALNLPPALKAGMARGGTAQEAGAMFAAMTHGMTDPMGRKSGTAMIGLVENLSNLEKILAEAKPDEDKLAGQEGRGLLGLKDSGPDPARARLIAQIPKTGGLSARLAFLQQNEEARRLFLGSTTYEAKAQESVESLLSGGKVAKDYAAFVGQVPTGQEAGEAFQRRLAVREGAPGQQVAGFARAIGSVVEGIQVSDPRQAALGVVREKFQPLLKSLGESGLSSQLAEVRADVGGGGLEQFRAAVVQRREELLSSKSRQAQRMGPSPYAALVPEQPPTKTELEQAAKLDQLVKALDKMNAHLADQSKDTKRTATATEKLVEKPGRVALGHPGEDR